MGKGMGQGTGHQDIDEKTRIDVIIIYGRRSQQEQWSRSGRRMWGRMIGKRSLIGSSERVGEEGREKAVGGRQQEAGRKRGGARKSAELKGDEGAGQGPFQGNTEAGGGGAEAGCTE